LLTTNISYSCDVSHYDFGRFSLSWPTFTLNIQQSNKTLIFDKVKHLEHVDNWFLKIILYYFNRYIFKNQLSTYSRQRFYCISKIKTSFQLSLIPSITWNDNTCVFKSLFHCLISCVCDRKYMGRSFKNFTSSIIIHIIWSINVDSSVGI
jgi:hypothetical protein